jgi:SAM-dependent methyltransferase
MTSTSLDYTTLMKGMPRLGPGSDTVSEAIAHWVQAESAARVLEVGCGHGATARILAERTPGLVVATDKSTQCVVRTREAVSGGQASRAVACAADVTQLPFADETFDAIVAEGCLYLTGLRRSLGLLRPLLRPGGRLAFTHFGWTRTRVPTPMRNFWEDGLPERFVRGEAYLVLLEHAGFKAVHLEPFPRKEWEEYYTALRSRLAELDGAYQDEASITLLNNMREEIKLFETGGLNFYAYFLIVGERSA